MSLLCVMSWLRLLLLLAFVLQPSDSIAPKPRNNEPSPIPFDQFVNQFDPWYVNFKAREKGLLNGTIPDDKKEKTGFAPFASDCTWCPRWPKDDTSGKYIVPYTMSGYNGDFEGLIRESMDYIERGSNVKFVPRASEADYVHIQKGPSCYSLLGRAGGEQELVLGESECGFHGVIIHELFHALGFEHEHQRPDRTSWINMHLENLIMPAMSSQLVVSKDANPDLTPFDFTSVMIYAPNAFAKEGTKTMTPKDAKYLLRFIRHKQVPSSCDWYALNTLYPGAIKPPKCIPHQENDKVCKPGPNCEKNLPSNYPACPDVCRDFCKAGMFIDLCVYHNDKNLPVIPHIDGVNFDGTKYDPEGGGDVDESTLSPPSPDETTTAPIGGVVTTRPPLPTNPSGKLDCQLLESELCRHICEKNCPTFYPTLSLPECLEKHNVDCSGGGNGDTLHRPFLWGVGTLVVMMTVQAL